MIRRDLWQVCAALCTMLSVATGAVAEAPVSAPRPPERAASGTPEATPAVPEIRPTARADPLPPARPMPRPVTAPGGMRQAATLPQDTVPILTLIVTPPAAPVLPGLLSRSVPGIGPRQSAAAYPAPPPRLAWVERRLRPAVSPDTAALGRMLARNSTIFRRDAPGRPRARPAQVPLAALIDRAGPAQPGDPGGLSAKALAFLSDAAVTLAQRPEVRPEGITLAAIAVQAERARGSVCGNPDIQGSTLARIDGPGTCGVAAPVSVRSVGGIRLSSAATMDCATAEALLTWVRRAAIPAVGDTGGGLASIQVIGGYTCRPRNNVAGARLSEHGKGKAIDIGGFALRNGNEISVLNGWGSASRGALLRQLHAGACGIFGTVLGPAANAAHRDHFHFDTAANRSGSYCR